MHKKMDQQKVRLLALDSLKWCTYLVAIKNRPAWPVVSQKIPRCSKVLLDVLKKGEKSYVGLLSKNVLSLLTNEWDELSATLN